MTRLSPDDAWKEIFEKYSILEAIEKDSSYVITSQKINEFHEARLMTKFDSSAQLLKIFKENDLAILPLTRGSYTIGRFSAYCKLDYPTSPPIEVLPPDCQSLDYTNLYSESAALSFAFNSGIIYDIMQDDSARFTVNGRMSSGAFSFSINGLAAHSSYTISIQNSQIEIDAGYEGHETFCIVEAKNIAPADFLIRQLYYPYRLWCSKLTKPILCVFLIYSNDIFTAFKYKFEDLLQYNSLNLLAVKRYAIASEPITLQDVSTVHDNIVSLEEPKLQFPQANSFERVIDLLSILADHDLSRDETTARYEFNERQTNYYSDACRYLGLVEKYVDQNSVMYKLTPLARKIMSKRHKEKILELIRIIFTRPIFYYAFRAVLVGASIPSDDKLVDIFSRNKPAIAINEPTVRRRISTVKSWLEWFLRQCE